MEPLSPLLPLGNEGVYISQDLCNVYYGYYLSSTNLVSIAITVVLVFAVYDILVSFFKNWLPTLKKAINKTLK